MAQAGPHPARRHHEIAHRDGWRYAGDAEQKLVEALFVLGEDVIAFRSLFHSPDDALELGNFVLADQFDALISRSVPRAWIATSRFVVLAMTALVTRVSPVADAGYNCARKQPDR